MGWLVLLYLFISHWCFFEINVVNNVKLRPQKKVFSPLYSHSFLPKATSLRENMVRFLDIPSTTF